MNLVKNDEQLVRELKRKTRFGQFTNQSMHTLAHLTRSKGLKQSITKKKVAIRSKWKEIAMRATLEETDETDNPDGRTRKTSTVVNKFGKAVIAAAAKEKARIAMENANRNSGDYDDYDDVIIAPPLDGVKEEEEQTVIAHFEKEEEGDQDGAQTGGQDGGEEDGDPYYSVIPPRPPLPDIFPAIPVTSRDGVDNDAMDMSNIKLQVPKVDDDEWPDENVYANENENEAQNMDNADVLF